MEKDLVKVSMLPWVESREDKIRLWKIMAACLGGSLLLMLLINVISYPEMDRTKAEKIPARIAKMILEKEKENPPPPPPPPEPETENDEPEPEPLVEPEPEPLPEPEPEVERELIPEPEPEPVEVAKPEPVEEVKPVVKPVKKKEKVVQEAKEKAAKTGVLAMSKQLSSLQNLSSIKNPASTRITTAEAGSSERNDNDLINQRAQDGSGGVETTEVAKKQSEQLQDRDTTKIASAATGEEDAAEAARNKLRTSEEIRLVFDKSKNAFYALYKRALRTNLGLQGRVVFNLTIAPDGSVTKCEIVSSDLNQPGLERKLIARILLINFGEKDVKEWEEEYYMDFSPAG